MKYKSLNKLSKDVINCKKCSLYKHRNKAVPGDGNKLSKFVFVGEAPGADEDKNGIPFCGRGGKLLRKNIEKAGIKKNEIYITNLVKCRPPNNRIPTDNEINSCKNYLQEELRLIKPELTILLGKTAIKNMHNDVLLKEKHGKIIKKINKRYLLTYHPAAILRNPNRTKAFLSDLKKIKKSKKQKSQSIESTLEQMKSMIKQKTKKELTMLGEVKEEKDGGRLLLINK